MRLEDVEPIPVVNGTLLWRPVRRTLDIAAFGINAYVAQKAGDDVVEEHTEESLGHEEVYVVLSGRATFTLDDEALDAPAGTVVFVRDVTVNAPRARRGAEHRRPGGRRPARAALRAVGVGGLLRSGEAPYGWRLRHVPHGARGSAGQRPDHPATLYNLACAEALVGRSDDALAHLRRALELKPEWAEMAAKDDDFASLRERPGWPL